MTFVLFSFFPIVIGGVMLMVAAAIVAAHGAWSFCLDLAGIRDVDQHTTTTPPATGDEGEPTPRAVLSWFVPDFQGYMTRFEQRAVLEALGEYAEQCDRSPANMADFRKLVTAARAVFGEGFFPHIEPAAYRNSTALRGGFYYLPYISICVYMHTGPR